MANLAKRPQWANELEVVSVFTDFTEDQNDSFWIDTITDAGTVAYGDDVNGVATLTPSDGTVADNDEASIASANELFRFGTNRSIYGRWKFRYTAVVAADPNWAVGFQNAVGANTIVDNGGVKVSGSTLAIEKKDGETAFRCTSACNGTSTTTLSNKTMAAATDYVAEIECVDWDGVSMEVSYKIDGEYLKDTNGTVIRHTVAIASSTEMQIFAAIKLGAAVNNDTVLLDYMGGCQTRV